MKIEIINFEQNKFAAKEQVASRNDHTRRLSLTSIVVVVTHDHPRRLQLEIVNGVSAINACETQALLSCVQFLTFLRESIDIFFSVKL